MSQAADNDPEAGEAKSEGPTRVGVLLVHGVGEQRHFEHLEAEVRNLARAMDALPQVERISVVARTSQDGAVHADRITWRADKTAPICVDVREKAGTITKIEFREVWWADLDERATLWSQINFWLWGLAQWAETGEAAVGHRLSDFGKLRPPQPASGPRSRVARPWTRFRLFAVASIFFLMLLTLSFLNFVFSRLLKGRIPGPDILASYVGDVKLMVQSGREGGGSLSDLNLPPRVSIRRRMVQALVDMATENYDRWYILAHSLGTVVAHNGLMETELCLANYLDQERWDRCRTHAIVEGPGAPKGALGGRSEALPPDSAEGKKMMPARPTWLDHQDVIHRRRLFARLRGLLTYGSPLDKFATLWPWIVPINDEPVFANEFQWINVYDETDPIAGSIDDFDPLVGPTGSAGPMPAKPWNLAFRAYPILLLSHLRYLAFRPDRSAGLVQRTAAWLMQSGGGGFPLPVPDAAPGWQFGGVGQGLRRAWRYLQWALVGIVLAWALGGLLSMVTPVFPPTEVMLQLTDSSSSANLWLNWIVYGLALAGAVAFAAGLLRTARAHKLFP